MSNPEHVIGSPGSHAGGSQGLDSFQNAREIARLLWGNKKPILFFTLFATSLGLVYSLIATPIYQSDAVIAPKENTGGASSSLLSQIGGLGGMLSAQLGSGNVDRLETILNSRDLAEKVIRDNDLLPLLFPGKWDSQAKRWKKPAETPTLLQAVKALQDRYLTTTSSARKKNVALAIQFWDSAYSKKIADFYLTALNGLSRDRIIAESENNQKYLDDQLAKTSDPQIRTKIQDLIGREIEKTMIMSSSGFDVLESPGYPLRKLKPNLKMNLAITFFFGLTLSVIAIIALDMFGYRIRGFRIQGRN